MFRFIYNLLFPIALVLVLPSYLAKLRRRGNYRQKFWQRFGFYDAAVRARLASGGRFWLHAVSVGEVAVALKLAAKLRAEDPAFRCVLTTTTTTGFAFANQPTREWMEVMYNPIDWWPIARRAFALVRPVKLVLVEAEVWPNLVAIARARRVPVGLVNARLSRRSERRFYRFRFATAPTFRCLDLVCVQESADKARWASLGVPAERIRVAGSVKFDPENTATSGADLATVLREFGIAAEQPILLGGSTHAGEEEWLAGVYEQSRLEIPDLVLIIAPRHVERTTAIRETLARRGFPAALRTAPQQARCVLLDTTGELRAWYSVATVVFIGKSILGRGGQNPVEAIVAGKPVTFGPHMENFRALADELLARGGAVQVSNAGELTSTVGRLIREPEAAARLVAAAREVIAAHAGATARTVAWLNELSSHARVRY